MTNRTLIVLLSISLTGLVVAAPTDADAQHARGHHARHDKRHKRGHHRGRVNLNIGGYWGSHHGHGSHHGYYGHHGYFGHHGHGTSLSISYGPRLGGHRHHRRTRARVFVPHDHRHVHTTRTVVTGPTDYVAPPQTAPSFSPPLPTCPGGTHATLAGNQTWCRTTTGDRHGPYQAWYRDGTMASDGGYSSGVRHGEWREYHPNGAIREEGRYEEGHRVGVWTTWDSEGNRLQTYDYSAQPAPAPAVQPEPEQDEHPT